MKNSLVLFCLLISARSFAFNVKDECESLIKCTEAISKLTGVKYFYSSDLKGKLIATSNLVLTKANADEYFSHFLFLNGYTRIPTKEKDTFNIISARDIRYSPANQLIASHNKPPVLPNSYDYYMMTYKLKHVDGTNLVRVFRPFMSRYGRLLSYTGRKHIVIQDTAINIKRLIQMIKELDKPPTAEAKKKIAEKNKQRHEIAKIKAKNCNSKK